MATKAKSKKSVKKSGRASRGKVTKLRPEDDSAGIGHNGKINKELKKIFKDFGDLDEDGKAIAKAKRDLRARAKEEHGILSSVFNHEVKLQKMDSDARVMFEQGHHDLKDMIGYQMALALNEDRDDEDAPDPEEAAASAAG